MSGIAPVQGRASLPPRLTQSPQVGPMGRTPVSVLRMRPWLDIYPDREAAEVLHAGFTDGFFIPYILFRSLFIC